MKKGIFIVIIIAVLVAGGVLFSRNSKDQNLTTAPPAVPFQPDSQTLEQATDPKNNSTAATPANYDPNTCKGQTYICFTPYYKKLVTEQGIDAAFADLKKRYNDNPDVVTMCHPLTHIIGNAASSKYATVSEAYLHGDAFCWSGYYHGILEGVIDRIGLKELPSKINGICADIPGKAAYNFDYYNCVHGLGHGIMEALHDEVPASLKMCDDLVGNWEQLSCYSGVFMENIINDNKNHNSKYLRPAQPLYPCNILETKYKDQCYLGQTSYALQVTNYDFKKVFGMCATVGEPLRDTCNQSMGRDAANQAYHEKVRTRDLCALAPNQNDNLNCITGAVKEIISYYHSDVEAKEFCNVLTEDSKRTCLDTTASYYSLF